MPDLMDAEQELQALELEALNRRARLQVPEVRSNITQMFCGDCGRPIDPKRVQAMPYVKDCVMCAGDKENRTRHYRRVMNVR